MTQDTLDPLKLPIWRMVHEGFVGGREEVIYEICHPRYRNDTSVRAVPDGPAGLVGHIRNARANIHDIQLNIVDILAQGDRAAVIWQTKGVAGSYVGVGRSGGDTSAWLIGHFGYVDGLILDHLINWEPLRLMVQGGAVIGPGGADVSSMDLARLRYEDFDDFADREQACRPREAPQDERLADLVKSALLYSWGASQVAPAVDPAAYFSFADLPDQHGSDGLLARREMAREAFANVRGDMRICVADGNRVILRYSLALQHVGDWLGMEGSGRHLEATGSVYAKIEDGRIVSWIELTDVLRLVREIGGFAAALPGCMPSQ